MFRLLVSSFILFSLFSISAPLQARHHLSVNGRVSRTVVQKLNRNALTRSKLLVQFHKWKGVRYHLRGNTAAGIDCSALTQKVYFAAMMKKIPRTTGEQIQEGKAIPLAQLQPGDLVFFKPRKSIRHVGIYIGNDQFLHASSSKGVTLSNLHNLFWKYHFETARRISG